MMSRLKMRMWLIDYGYGQARLWGRFKDEEVEHKFYLYANQCFGIRKSIMHCHILKVIDEQIPELWKKLLPGAEVMLEHSDDRIIWGKDPDTKLKSEWD